LLDVEVSTTPNIVNGFFSDEEKKYSIFVSFAKKTRAALDRRTGVC
jgi:hypothetical protein